MSSKLPVDEGVNCEREDNVAFRLSPSRWNSNALGMLGPPPDYDTDEAPTEQSYTTVTIADVDGSYVHLAYALGQVASGSSDARDALDVFVGDLRDLERLVGSEHIGPAERYQPEQWQVSIDGGPGAAGRTRIGHGRSNGPHGMAARRSRPSTGVTSPAPTPPSWTAPSKRC